ncbi:MAG TPA: manganese efflux pump MntP family protein [Anaerovoracaceae bacterium]|nr:manganese efflux pump MntP family protein [Anaerovoracaceae bacterium]
MDGFELFAIALGLSMDALAVAITKGLCLRKMQYKYAAITGLFFGGFQALMPLIGYYLGKQFEDYLTVIDHWIIFGLLSLIGINMILESRKEEKEKCDTLNLKNMTILSLATSIDAFAVGITFAFLHANIFVSVAVIGLTTFVLSFFGVIVGNMFGSRFKSKAEITGGIVLILIGVKILLEHLGYLAP